MSENHRRAQQEKHRPERRIRQSRNQKSLSKYAKRAALLLDDLVFMCDVFFLSKTSVSLKFPITTAGTLQPARQTQTKTSKNSKSPKQKKPNPETALFNKNLQFSSVILDYFQHFRFHRLPAPCFKRSKADFQSQLTSWMV